MNLWEPELLSFYTCSINASTSIIASTANTDSGRCRAKVAGSTILKGRRDEIKGEWDVLVKESFNNVPEIWLEVW